MVDPHDVVDLEAFTASVQSNIVAIFVHCFPVIDWVPQSWPVAENSSGGHPAVSRFPFLSVFEEMRVRPHVTWIFRYIDWHVSDDFNVMVIGISFQGQPLLEEEELSHTMVSQLIRQFFTVLSQSFLPRARIAASGHSVQAFKSKCSLIAMYSAKSSNQEALASQNSWILFDHLI